MLTAKLNEHSMRIVPMALLYLDKTGNVIVFLASRIRYEARFVRDLWIENTHPLNLNGDVSSQNLTKEHWPLCHIGHTLNS